MALFARGMEVDRVGSNLVGARIAGAAAHADANACCATLGDCGAWRQQSAHPEQINEVLGDHGPATVRCGQTAVSV